MAERVPAAIALRQRERQEIEDQIKAFLENGGRIEQIPLNNNYTKPVGRIWDSSYAALLEG